MKPLQPLPPDSLRERPLGLLLPRGLGRAGDGTGALGEAALDEGRFSDLAAKAKKKIVPEELPHMQMLQSAFKAQIAPMANEDNPATADDVYKAILRFWAHAWDMGGISQEKLAEITKNMDAIRQEWAEQPEPIIGHSGKAYTDPETGEDVYEPVFAHKIGQHGFWTEKEQLVALAAQWITAGTVGSASRFDAAPAFGTHKWMERPAGGAEASAKPPAPGKRKSKGVTKVDSIFNKFAPPEESVEHIADFITEDVDDTWLGEDALGEDPLDEYPLGGYDDAGDGVLLEEMGAQQAPAAPGAPAGQQPPAAATATQQTAQNQNFEQAKQAAGKMLDGLLKQLQILQGSPDWQVKVKPDLLKKLQPFLK